MSPGLHVSGGGADPPEDLPPTDLVGYTLLPTVVVSGTRMSQDLSFLPVGTVSSSAPMGSETHSFNRGPGGGSRASGSSSAQTTRYLLNGSHSFSVATGLLGFDYNEDGSIHWVESVGSAVEVGGYVYDIATIPSGEGKVVSMAVFLIVREILETKVRKALTVKITKKALKGLDNQTIKKINAVISKGIVGPKDTGGILILKESNMLKAGYTHKIKLNPKGKAAGVRIYGTKQADGTIIFNKLVREHKK